jgi:hypothetical protein
MRTGPFPVHREGPFFQPESENNAGELLKNKRSSIKVKFLLIITKTSIAYAKENNRAKQNVLHAAGASPGLMRLICPKNSIWKSD